MSKNVLVGVPGNCPPQFEQKFETCLRQVLQEEQTQIKFVHSINEFGSEIHGPLPYEIIIAMEGVNRQREYTKLLDDYGKEITDYKVIIIVPDDCRGTVYLQELAEYGFYNAVYMSDVSGRLLAKLIKHKRTHEEALAYYDVAKQTELVKQENTHPEKAEIQIGKEIRLSPTLSVTRVSAGQARKNEIGDIGSDSALQEFLNQDDYDLYNQDTENMPTMNFTLEAEWLEEYKVKLRNYFQSQGLIEFQSYENGTITAEEFEEFIMNRIYGYQLDEDKSRELYMSFMRDVDSYGKLDELLNTEDVTDIRLLNHETVNVQVKGVWYKTNLSFGKEEYTYFINRICAKNHVSMNIQQAQIIFSDPDTNPHARLRFTATHSLLSSNKMSSMHIRKIDKIKKSAAELVKEGLWTSSQAGFLINAIRHGKSIILCGGSGSGKTVVLNNLIEYAPDGICGICIQEAEELSSDRKINMEFLHSISARGESRVEYTLRDLSTMGLLKNAQLYIIGEIKGDEARDFFTAGNTGAQVMCTTHANKFYEALPRIADLAKYTGDYSQADLLKMLSRSIDYVVYMEKYKVVTIAGVVGWDEKLQDVIYDIYHFDKAA